MTTLRFGSARDLADAIYDMVDGYGEGLTIAFYVDEKTAINANSSIVGSISVDSVEETIPPRLDLTFTKPGD